MGELALATAAHWALELPDCADPACVHSVQTAAAVQTYMNDTSRERDQAFISWQL